MVCTHGKLRICVDLRKLNSAGKWFEPRSLSRLCGLIVRVRVFPRRTVVGDIDRRFNKLSGSHHQSHVNCGSSVYGIYVSGQLSRDVIGCFKSNRWLSRDVIGCCFVKSCCYLLSRLIGRREFGLYACQVCFVSLQLVVCTVPVIVGIGCVAFVPR